MLSAVIVISTLVIILFIFQSGRIVYSDIMMGEAHYIAANIKEVCNNIVKEDCLSAEKRVEEFEHVVNEELVPKGMYVKIEKNINCLFGYAEFNLFVVSENEQVNASWILTI